MVSCRICGCLCDPSDLVNEVCDFCRDEESIRDEKADALQRALQAEFKQMEIEDMIENGY